ncbi:MAG: UDP-N-acetylmuramate--L-alanine ligase [Candidatus Zixiibacteriota bacterium]|nr:MAG: UDP-N-acetylmuramate--L-alanine ligase [candidate division Zixibacteria bacterium]
MQNIVEIQTRFRNRKMIFGKIKELFFVGIGGAGMSGIAEILFNLGFKISGSDLYVTDVTRRLESIGIPVFNKHTPGNIGTANAVVISSAVGEDNPEVIEAKRRGVAVIKRAEMLGELMRLKYSIGIAGTHGKTTVTSMIGKIMADAGLDPTVIVGGIVSGKGSGAALGNGEYLVAEADEYDRSFLAMYPSMAVITNIEPEHLDCYDGQEDLENSFVTYMNRVPFYGLVIYPADDPIMARLYPRLTRASVSFGFGPGADYQASGVKLKEGGSQFTVFQKNDLLGDVYLNVPGRHNVSNALAAIASTMELEVPFEKAAAALGKFGGVQRRFDIKGTVNDIMVVDDYAHHPTEIKATLETARSFNRRVIVIYQPHLFTRTGQFYKEFAEALRLADIALLVDIYPAREEPIAGVTSEIIEENAHEKGYDNIKYIGAEKNCLEEIEKISRAGDMIITMGAGTITRMAPALLERLSK